MKQTILYFFDYGTSFGGAANTLLRRMLLMQKAGYQVYGFFSGYLGNPLGEEYASVLKLCGISLQQVNYVVSTQTEDIDLIGTLECYEEMKQVIESFQPILLHSVQINPTAELVSRELGIPHIMDLYPAYSDFFKVPYSNVFPQYHICDSLYYAKKWSEGLGIQSFCVRTVAERQVQRKKASGGELTFVCVGFVVAIKRQLAVIQSFQKALEKGVRGRLKIYGRDVEPYADKCREYIVEQGLEEKVVICGFHSEQTEIYENADVLICGSSLESYPNVITEALANGVAVVSTPVAGVPEVIKDRENGFLCSGYEVEEMSEKIAEAYQAFQDGSIQVILQRAEDTFRHTHSAEQVSAELQSVYRFVMEQGVHGELPGIREIRAKFAGFLNLYHAHEKEFLKPNFIRKKLWYLYHVNPLIHAQMKKGRKLYIWGAGKIGACILQMNRLMELGWRIEGFVDGSRSEAYMEYPVSRPEEKISDREAVILIAFLAGTVEAMEQLRKAGRSYAEDYFLLTPRSW